MTYQFLTLALENDIAILSLNRPAVGNALSIKLIEEIIDAVNSLKYNVDIKVVIFRGEGRHFSVGADLKDPDRLEAGSDADLLKKSRTTQFGRELIETIMRMNQISIAAVQGAAAGGGACITTACDFRIASNDCKIGYPEVKLGMNLSWGALPLCYNLVGPARAKRMVIGGELEQASDLLEWGFVDELVANEQLDSRARELADYYSTKPALAAQMIKRSLNAIQNSTSHALMHMDGDQFTLAAESEDYQLQREAFLSRLKS